MVLHINLRDSAPPFKGGDSVFDSGISFIYAGVAEPEYASDLKSDARKGLGVRLPSPAPFVQLNIERPRTQ